MARVTAPVPEIPTGLRIASVDRSRVDLDTFSSDRSVKGPPVLTLSLSPLSDDAFRVAFTAKTLPPLTELNFTRVALLQH